MSSPKKKIFRDKVRVYSTKAGSQYVRPGDVILSKEVKEDIRTIQRVFGKPSKNGVAEPASEPKKSDE